MRINQNKSKNRKRLWYISAFLIGIMFLTACQNTSANLDTSDLRHESNQAEGLERGTGDEPSSLSELKADASLRVLFASDIHYLSKSLYEMNETFNRFMTSGDDKLIQYSTEILEALVTQIQLNPPDYLIVTGDLTTNGELNSHVDLAGYFKEVESYGTEVLVIPGNHDINNPYALSFLDNQRAYVDSISPEGFEETYSDFGYGQALSKDPNSLSYLARLSQNTYALMLDTCVYDFNEIMGYPVTRGVLSDETLTWIDSLYEIIPKGAKVISASHHNMVVHAEILSDGYTLDNAEEAVDHLEKLGIETNFSGHIHTQDWKQADNFIDIVTGALIQYPQTYAELTTSEEGFIYETHWVDVETYAKEKGIQDAFLLDFKNAASDYFYKSSLRLTNKAELGKTAEEIALMGDVVARLNMAYFAGEEPTIKDEIIGSPGYQLWLSESEGFVSKYMDTLTADDYYGNYYDYRWPSGLK